MVSQLLLLAAISGDLQAKSDVVQAHEQTLMYIAKSWPTIPGLDFEDVLSECYIATLSCIKDYNPELSKFETFLRRAVTNHLKRLKRDTKCAKRFSSGTVYLYDLDENYPSNMNTELIAIGNVQYEQMIDRAYEALYDDKDKYILQRMIEGDSQSDIAESLGMQPQSVGYRQAKIRKRLESIFQED